MAQRGQTTCQEVTELEVQPAQVFLSPSRVPSPPPLSQRCGFHREGPGSRALDRTQVVQPPRDR